MSLREKLDTKKFVVTSEVAPPKGTNVRPVIEEAEKMAQFVDAVNVTEQQRAIMRVSSMAMSSLLVKRGVEPICQLTCRDRNRLALQSELISAYCLGIRNVLVISGDHPKMGDHPGAKPVYDLDSVQLIQAASNLKKGNDLAGRELDGAPDLFLGGALYPGADPLEPETIKMEKKIEAGCQFFQTQAIFDAAVFENFIKTIGEPKAPILVGIVILKSEKMARFMNKNLPGVHVPDELILEMEKASDKQAKGVEIAGRIIKDLKPLAQGVHVMPIGWNHLLQPVLKEAGIL